MAGGELGLELSNASQGLQSYLQATSLISAISENFSCTASTSAGGLQLTKSTTFRITVVGKLFACSGACRFLVSVGLPGLTPLSPTFAWLVVFCLFMTHYTCHHASCTDVCDTDNVLAPEIDAWHGTGGAEFREVNCKWLQNV